MFYLKLIRYFFLFLTFLVVFTPVSYSLLDFTPSLILLWITYIVFSKRFLKSKNFDYKNIKVHLDDNNTYLINNQKNIIFTMIIALIFIPLYAKFYTGSNIITGLKLFLSGNAVGSESTYALYQQHFASSGLQQFSIKKLPFIIGGGVLKLIFWTTTLKLIGFTRNISKLEIIWLFVFFFLYFALGTTRGTSFENFELLFILIFSTLLRFQVLHSASWIKGKTKIFIYCIILLVGFYFIYSKSLRYSGDITYISESSNSLKYNPNHFTALHFPFISTITSHLSGYFLFGMYVISNALNETILSGSSAGIFASIMPFGLNIMNYGNSYRDFLCGDYIDCGVAWIPDSLFFIQTTGLILFLLLISFLGRISIKIFPKIIQGSVWHATLLFLITLLMFSLPIGNFITASSSNIIAIFLLLVLYYKPFYKKIFTPHIKTFNEEKNINL